MPAEIELTESQIKKQCGGLLPQPLSASCILLGLLAANWPFTRQGMIARLERASSAQAQIQGFRSTYFPYPGCVAEDVVFRVAGAKSTELMIG
jgi:hypothetical protein